MRKKLLTYFVMYLMINICTYFAMAIGNHTLNAHAFTNLTNVTEAIIFWLASVLWIIISGVIYWEEKFNE